jgi:hypothetical protein
VTPATPPATSSAPSRYAAGQSRSGKAGLCSARYGRSATRLIFVAGL